MASLVAGLQRALASALQQPLLGVAHETCRQGGETAGLQDCSLGTWDEHGG